MAAEVIGWLPLESCLSHVSKWNEAEPGITIVGLPDAGMTGMNVLLLTCASE